jgi:Domain of Unknown Function (DUF1206)
MALKTPEDSAAVQGAQRQGEKVARRRQFEWLARGGLASRGVVYAVIGILALKLAVGDGGKSTNQQGALKTIAQGPFGKTLLIALAIGLAGYAIWRLARAALGHGQEQKDSGGDRVAALASAIAYTILCVAAVQILIGSSTGSGTPKEATGGLLDWTGGPLLVGIAGAAMIGVAGYQASKGLRRTFLDDSKIEQMSHTVRNAFTALGIFGHVARAVVFALVGYGLIRAAVDYDAQKAVGLDGALRQVADASYGPWLLGLVALGLIGFAAYSAADARYRKI